MWWDDAQTVGSYVRWYFVDGNDFIPFPHRYCSEIWDRVHWFNDQAGEADDLPQPYDKGAPPVPAPPGVHVCGPEEWWRDGAPSDAPPLAIAAGVQPCCVAGLVGPYDLSYAPVFDRVRSI
jgi:hypothetical protein